jgi:hypothetical protein
LLQVGKESGNGQLGLAGTFAEQGGEDPKESLTDSSEPRWHSFSEAFVVSEETPSDLRGTYLLLSDSLYLEV